MDEFLSIWKVSENGFSSSYVLFLFVYWAGLCFVPILPSYYPILFANDNWTIAYKIGSWAFVFVARWLDKWDLQEETQPLSLKHTKFSVFKKDLTIYFPKPVPFIVTLLLLPIITHV